MPQGQRHVRKYALAFGLLVTGLLVTGLLVTGLLLIGPSCGADRTAKPVGPGSDEQQHVVARVGTRVIEAGDVEAELERLPEAVQLRFASRERKVDLLRRVVQLELLAQAARKEGRQHDPIVIRRLRRALAEEAGRELALEQARSGSSSGGSAPADQLAALERAIEQLKARSRLQIFQDKIARVDEPPREARGPKDKLRLGR